MNYPDRGATIYQDLTYLVSLVFTNAIILGVLSLGLLFFMTHYGYKTITIKFSKKNKYLKTLKKYQKHKEEKYLSKLETNLGKKKKKAKS